jgi:hypothetical protein
MARDGARRVRQPAGRSGRCDTLRAAPRAYYVSRKKEKKMNRDVPTSTKESRDLRGRVVEWLC